MYKKMQNTYRRLLKNSKRQKGFTLVELLVATVIFVYIATMSITVFSSALNAQRRINVKRILQEDVRFVIEKMVKEFRNGSIDYPAYYLVNQEAGLHFNSTLDADDYFIYTELPTHASAGNAICLEPPDNACERATPQNNVEEEILFVNSSGTIRTRFKIDTVDVDGVEINSVFMAKESYEDVSGTYTWLPEDGFSEAGALEYQVISPPTVDVTNFKAYINPVKDPNFIYDDTSIQSQTMVTLIIEAQYFDRTGTLKGDMPTISLQTSVSSRNYNRAVTWEET